MALRMFKEFIQIKWLLVGIVILCYGFGLRGDIVSDAREYSLHVNGWDVMYSLQNDMYLMVFFLIPIMIFTSVKLITSAFHYALLIRVKSFHAWMLYTTKEFLIQIYPMFILLFMFSIITSLGLPFELQWSEYASWRNGANELNELYPTFQHLVTPLCIQLVLWIATSMSLHGMIVLSFLIHQKDQYLYVQASLFFLVYVIGFKVFPLDMKFLSPSVYFTIAASIHAVSNAWIIVFVPIFLFTLEYLTIQQLSRFSVMLKKIKRDMLPSILYGALSFVYVFTTYQSNKMNLETVGDFLTLVFLGVSAVSSSFTSLFAYLILFFGLVYLSQLRLSREMGEIGQYKIIRYGSVDQWFYRVFVKESLFLLSALLVIIGVTSLFGIFNGLHPSLQTELTSLRDVDLILFVICFSFLQLVCYFLFSFITLWKSSEGYYSLLLFGVLSFMLLPGINVWGVFPVGLNAVVMTESFSVQHLFVVLLTYILGSLVYLKIIFSKSLTI